MKRILVLILCLMLCLTACAPQTQTQAPDKTLEESLVQAQTEYEATQQKEWKAKVQASALSKKTVKLYVVIPDEAKDVELAYLDAYEDVPFMDVEAFVSEILLKLFHDDNDTKVYDISTENADNTITLTRENGANMTMDFDDNAVIFDDQALFGKKPYQSTSLDVLAATGFDKEGNPAYFSRSPVSFERKGSSLAIDMNKRYIPMVYRDGKGYLPLQTLNDFLLAPHGYNILCNGENLFLVSGGTLDELSDLYYSVPAGERSESMATFSTSQLCLALDMYYGLKEAHDIDSFSNLFATTGLYEELTSTDAVVSTKALSKLTFGYLADLHTAVAAVSHYAGKDTQAGADVGSTAINVYNSVMNMQRYQTARAEVYPNGVSAYEEIGNTAYVTFDHFLVNARDYYAEPPTAEEVNTLDTMGLVIYAHSQITRENSPIKNVVIDLSNNGGGQVDAAIYVISWFLGNCTINFADTTNGGHSSTMYQADVNLDRAFDASDSITSKNRYCIISPNSFSCGNLVPASFKSSGVVTLMGKASGGGACVVMQGSTADGTLLNYSSNRRLSTVSNGSYYDVDNGVEPDIPLTHLSSFYNRKALADYINKLI